MLGYKPAKVKQATLEVLTPNVKFGEFVEFTFSLLSDSNKDQALIIDYIIHHQKNSGKTTPKVFKWKVTTLPANKELLAIKNMP